MEEYDPSETIKGTHRLAKSGVAPLEKPLSEADVRVAIKVIDRIEKISGFNFKTAEQHSTVQIEAQTTYGCANHIRRWLSDYLEYSNIQKEAGGEGQG